MILNKVCQLLLTSGCLLGAGTTLLAEPACTVSTLRGTYNGQTMGYRLPPNGTALVPMACISQWKFDGAGTATGVVFCNTNGVNRSMDVRLTSINLNPMECTGEMEGTQVIRETGAVIPAKIKFVTAPSGEEIRILPVGSDVYPAEWRRVSTPWW